MINWKPWTEENEQKLKALVAAGNTQSQIAAEMGVTRNTVIGKMNRMGLKTLPKEQRAAKQPEPEKPSKPLAVVRAGAAPKTIVAGLKDIPIEKARRGVSLFDVRERQCRWPINDVRPISKFRFCGEPCDGMWCQRHTDIGYAKRAKDESVAA